jgi:hypothetical protein
LAQKLNLSDKDKAIKLFKFLITALT